MASVVMTYDEQPLVITAGAYAAGDVVGGLIQFNLGGKHGGVLQDVTLVDDDNIGASLELRLFRAAPTTILDNAPLALTAADLINEIGPGEIALSIYKTHNSNKRCNAMLSSGSQRFEFPGSVLFGYLSTATGSTPTYLTASALTLIVSAWVIRWQGNAPE